MLQRKSVTIVRAALKSTTLAGCGEAGLRRRALAVAETSEDAESATHKVVTAICNPAVGGIYEFTCWQGRGRHRRKPRHRQGHCAGACARRRDRLRHGPHHHVRPHPLPGTVGETAAEVDRRGGKGIAVEVDHANDEQVAALFDQVTQEQGRLDILVNNAISIPPELTQPGSFWEKPLSNWEMIDVGLRSNFVAAWHAAKLMVPQRSGLIVALSGYVGVTYTYSVIFGTCKTAADRMARDMAIELKPHNVASVSLWQGFTYTERARENLKTVPGMASQLNSAVGSSVEFPGRVIAALANDPQIMNARAERSSTPSWRRTTASPTRWPHHPVAARTTRGADLDADMNGQGAYAMLRKQWSACRVDGRSRCSQST